MNELFQRPANYWLRHADRHKQSGDLIRAAVLQRHAVHAETGSDAARIQYALTLRQMHCYEASNREAFRVLAQQPEQTELYGLIGCNMLALGARVVGGELARIMLAMKNVLAERDRVQTLIFDEVDTGVSGRAAQKVGIKLAETAQKRQVLCITHLAQIASQADYHLLIEKNTEGERTFTSIHQLDHEGRKAELARIIDGDGRSESSLQAAEEMLRRGN